MFVTQAYAQTAGGLGSFASMDNLMQFVPIVGIFGIMYFLMIRPQQNKLKAHREMVAKLRRGDRVLTQGGLIGVVGKVLSDSEILVDLADGVRVRCLRSAVTEVLEKTEPVAAGSDDETADAESDVPAPVVPTRKTGRRP